MACRRMGCRFARIGSARGVLMRLGHSDFDDGFDDRQTQKRKKPKLINHLGLSLGGKGVLPGCNTSR